MKKSYILASVVSLTLAGITPVAFAQRDSGRNSERYEVRADHRIPYSQVPGDAKRAIEPQLNQGDKVTDAFQYKRGDRTVYVVTTNDERIIRADDKGNLLSVRSTDDDAPQSGRVAVKYNGLPGEVKSTLGKEAKGHPMEIWKVTRDGKTFYVANIDDNEGTRRVRVDSEGNLMERPVFLSDRDDRARADRDDLDSRRRQDRARYRDAQKVELSELPGHIKSTVGAEQGQDKVGEILKINRDGKTVYRVDIEGENRAKTIWIDEQGKLLREMNDTEEGRVRVDISEVPGHIKSALINEAHGKEPKRIWQVTRGRETWYVGEANDGHLVRIDSEGKVMSHDSHPKLLSDRADRADNRDRNRDNDNRDRNRDDARDNNARDRDNRNDNVLQRPSDNANERNRNRGGDDKRFEKPKDLDKDNDGKIDGQKIEWADLPKDVQRTVMDNVRKDEKAKAIYKIKDDDRNFHYIIQTEDDRWIRVGQHGGLLGANR